MFSPLDILLAAGGVLVAAAITAPFLFLRRAGRGSLERAEPGARPAPVATPVPQELHRRLS
jgi:hypothetical protein